ncbi:MAG: myo-inositol-1-phosphate synthase [Planctomycetaceae bacterium]|jgi:myo-inositol-1-phosphate synthase|nr:myo-inositol-1-phosphate synthase [Planctomycetaceae bacterium]MBT6156453.1 myo-inositol-1-phosphate synthase [Planctomycetaceae bacterium]MBT6485469.1 myo-inositol-1-phosphate synthase [Planctomycetaceae bacterium]MBT6497265.1 myo-inositol-1-phosphate synthase [Planctomycetaceae bacterium]
MASEKIGIWLIGAWGGVSTTAATGLAALQQGVAEETALVSSLPRFEELELADWSQFVVGGHEIRDTGFVAEAAILQQKSRVFSPEMLEAVGPTLKQFDENVRTGTLWNVGQTISSFASSEAVELAKTEKPTDIISRIQSDVQTFRDANELDHVVVVNLSSTEPTIDSDSDKLSWSELSARLDSDESPLPASSLYAIAAMQAGCSYVNFTPSVGSNLPALNELAESQGVLHVGRDGKTGETLMKAVLAPMFADRNLNVMSWVGHNIFGNLDGKVLDDPINKASKVTSKDRLLTEILGYKPQSLVSIEYIESMADWKTAWDHIHFQGFLGTAMTLQFTWQGCDSILAAPLALDLVRFTERERRRGTSGVMTQLSSFFKSPMGTDVPPEFAKQYALLEAWADEVVAEG